MTRRALAAIVVIVSASVLLFIGMGPSLRRPTAWEEAEMSGASQANASQESLEGYHSVSVFDEARELGYGLAELEVSGTYYAVFTHGGSSLVISDRKNAAGDILLYDKIVDETDLTIGSFAFLTADYSDGRADSRSEYGKWSFSDLHKKELLEILNGFVSSGVPGFLCGTPEAEAYLTDELRALKSEYGLAVHVQKPQDGLYRFIFAAPDGRTAWFAADYSEADIPQTQYAYGLNTWDGGEAVIAGLRGESFARDLVLEDGRLHCSPERIAQLSAFFGG